MLRDRIEFVDGAIFSAINRLPEWLAPTMRFFSEATNYLWFKLLLVAFVLTLIWLGGRGRRAAVQALIAFPIANWVTDQFKHFLPEPRPFQVQHDVILRLGWADSPGTASAHSANMAAVAFVFVYQTGWWGTPWVAIALLTGMSRVYCGVHYPYQVLLGWVCGTLVAAAVTYGWEGFVKRRLASTHRDEPEPRLEEQA